MRKRSVFEAVLTALARPWVPVCGTLSMAQSRPAFTKLALVFALALPSTSLADGLLSSLCQRLLGGKNESPVVSGENRIRKEIYRYFHEVEPFTDKLHRPHMPEIEFSDRGLLVYDFQFLKLKLNLSSEILKSDFPREFFRAMIVHEFGHVLFTSNMAHMDKRWAEWYGKILSAARRGYGETPDPGGAHLLYMVSAPYQELFSDLIASVVTGDPAINMKVMSTFTKTPYSGRDFSQTMLNCSWSSNEDHRNLDPARAFIWENYFAKEKNRGREGQIIYAVFRALAAETIDAEKRLFISGTDRPIKKNGRLIQRLAKELKQFE